MWICRVILPSRSLWNNLFIMKTGVSYMLAMILCGGALSVMADDVVSKNSAGETLINTASLAKNIRGYAGPTPLLITLQKGKIKNVSLLPNVETPRYVKRVLSSGLMQKWDGMKVSEAEKAKVDAVTGATYTSKAVIANVHAAMTHARKNRIK